MPLSRSSYAAALTCFLVFEFIIAKLLTMIIFAFEVFLMLDSIIDDNRSSKSCKNFLIIL
jgi:hypothetical protein